MLPDTAALGVQDMPFAQVIILWIALCCDIASKVSFTIQTARFVDHGHYWWAAFILLFFVLSSIVSACYWASHYPGGIADQAVQMVPLQPLEGVLLPRCCCMQQASLTPGTAGVRSAVLQLLGGVVLPGFAACSMPLDCGIAGAAALWL